MFGDLRLSNPSDIDVPDGEVRAGGFATHGRPRVATAHGHALDDPVARGDLVALASKCSTTVNGLADSDAEACSDPTEPDSS
jgi:hypothetical protein